MRADPTLTTFARFSNRGSQFLTAAVIAIALSAAMPSDARAETARIAVAANFSAAMEQLEAAFEARTDHDLVVAYGSTGKLYAQIVNGAPFDVLLAADQERPRRLEDRAAIAAGSRVTYAVGRLVLWSPNGEAAGPDQLRACAMRRLSLANPDLAPYGAAAIETMRAVGAPGACASNRVYGENVAQAFAFARTGAADVGFVALSQLLALPPDQRGAHWEPSPDMHAPIRQDAALLLRGADNAAATAFISFLKSDDAAAIIERAGYRRP